MNNSNRKLRYVAQLLDFNFSRYGYDPFIDYLKGVCILFVVMTHAFSATVKNLTIFCLWGDLAVPLFLLLQCIHVYKKETIVSVNFRKLWNRVFRKFMLLQMIILALGVGKYCLSGESSISFVYEWITEGGVGRGSYYPWMYIEFAVLIVIFKPLFRKNLAIGGGYNIVTINHF